MHTLRILRAEGLEEAGFILQEELLEKQAVQANIEDENENRH